MPTASRKRYALVGTGGRATMFIDGIVDRFADHAELVGFCDVSQVRMNWHNRRIRQQFGRPPVPSFTDSKFDRMLRETRPEVLIVSSTDCTHHHYIIRALESGVDVITEKPMTIDAPKAAAILDAVERTASTLRVTFNYRYAPAVSRVCELLREGVVGRPLAVDFSWMLDVRHGADYFRRWHREKDKSGGLLVHKATHHFDLVNWWVGSVPEAVFAMGGLKFYGKENALRRGESYAYSRYTGYPDAKKDPFALDLQGNKSEDSVYAAETLTGLYRDAEAETGYIRDQNVFGEGITIEDTMAVLVRYRSGVLLNYSLLAYSPWEGFRAAITGEKGRLELEERHGSDYSHRLVLYPMFGCPYEIPIQKTEGGHGGSDPLLIEQLFSPDPPPDPLDRRASHWDGASSLLVGISANESVRTGQPVLCNELLPIPWPQLASR